MADCFPILSLPSELKHRATSFLSPQDALSLSETCKILHSSLALRLLRNSRILFASPQRFTGSVTNGDQKVPFVHVPCIGRRVHSLTITFRWRDQAWGYRKGQIWVIGRHRGAPIDKSREFHGGRIVCVSPLAPHDMEECRLSFSTCSMEGEVYQLWYRVGGGGGHQLNLYNGRLYTVIFDDEQGNLSRNYQILKNIGVIAVQPEASLPVSQSAFYPQLLLRLSGSLRAELQNQNGTTNRGGTLSAQFAPFFQNFNIPINEGSLLALEEIIQADLDHRALVQEQNHDDTNQDDDEGDEDRLHDPAFHEFVADIGNVFFGRQIRPQIFAGVGLDRPAHRIMVDFRTDIEDEFEPDDDDDDDVLAG